MCIRDRLTITVPSSKNIQVYVDGRAYQDNDNTIVLNNIQAGNHSITIYKNSRNANANNGNYGRNNQRDKKTTGAMCFTVPMFMFCLLYTSPSPRDS